MVVPWTKLSYHAKRNCYEKPLHGSRVTVAAGVDGVTIFRLVLVCLRGKRSTRSQIDTSVHIILLYIPFIVTGDEILDTMIQAT